MRSSRTAPRKSPGERTTARRPRVIRLTNELSEKVDAWAHSQPDKPHRSEAIRLLLEIALGSVLAKPQQAGTDMLRNRSRKRATELASNVIDDLGDEGVTSEVRANRKRRLMKGPEEFRNIRRDRSAR
jgi:hypothetical protein